MAEADISMQTHLKFLKLNQICPILAKNDWDYLKLAQSQELFQACCLEVMGWYARRGKPLSPAVLYTVLEQILIKKGMIGDSTDIVDAVKNFTKSTLYNKLDQPLINTEIQLKLKDLVIKYDVPILVTSGDIKYALLFDQTIQSKEDLAHSLEAKFISLWAFYVLNTYINIYNVIKVNDTASLINFRPTQQYIKEAKKNILNMGYLSYNINHSAHHLVCRQCSRREECLKIITTTVR